MNLAESINSIKAGGLGSGCNPAVGQCGRHPNGNIPGHAVNPPIHGELKPRESTEDRYKKADGTWQSSRARWHEASTIGHVNGRWYCHWNNEYCLGKQVLRNLQDTVRVDADDLKQLIPEYKRLKAIDPEHATNRVHEESSYMAKLILARAAARHLDITYDSTSSGKGGVTLAKKLADEGYSVHVLYADVPVELAKQRAIDRANNPDNPSGHGRFIPETVIEENQQASAANFMLYKDAPHVQSLHLYDTTEAKPRLVYSRVGQQAHMVHDREKWNTYKKKAGV